MNKANINNLDFKKMNGLIPAIIQDVKTQKVLMLGYMNCESLSETISSGFVTFFSRSKQSLWKKGATSGSVLRVREIVEDCDKDCLLIKVVPNGNTCHLGSYSCFQVEPGNENTDSLLELFSLIKKRKKNMPGNSYTTGLFKEGLDRILQKVGEESIEVILAAKNESKKRLAEEISDLLYHLLVMMVSREMNIKEVLKELDRRRKSGEN